tara:strand:+ start:480 stop:944 length:465 start_codon:yes stop_codon:yes gene_type:complete
MGEKKTAKKEKLENSQVDLQEILGDIKTVVSGEKETLFKVSEYKTINLKKENLVAKGNKRQSTEFVDINEKKLENLIRKIVRSELKNLQRKNKPAVVKSEKTKTSNETTISSDLNSLTKAKLLALSKKNKLGLSSRDTKAVIIKELKKFKVKAP